MPVMTKRELVRRARDLMNTNGLHWLQGEFFGYKWIPKKEDEVEAWCTAGALRHILTGSGDDLPMEGTPEYKVYAETVADIASVIRRRHPEYAESHPASSLGTLAVDENCIFDWNDSHRTTWADVNAVLSEVALIKAQKARPIAPSV